MVDYIKLLANQDLIGQDQASEARAWGKRLAKEALTNSPVARFLTLCAGMPVVAETLTIAPPGVVALDVETTGLGHNARPRRQDAVVQVGLAWRDATGALQTWERVCNPGDSFLANGRADKALLLNGLTIHQVQSAPFADAVAMDIHKLLDALQPVLFVAFNSGFDGPFLEDPPWNLDERGVPLVCAMLAAHDHLGTLKWPKLSEACDALGIDVAGRGHTAGVDALACLQVWEAIQGGDNGQAKNS